MAFRRALPAPSRASLSSFSLLPCSSSFSPAIPSVSSFSAASTAPFSALATAVSVPTSAPVGLSHPLSFAYSSLLTIHPSTATSRHMCTTSSKDADVASEDPAAAAAAADEPKADAEAEAGAADSADPAEAEDAVPEVSIESLEAELESAKAEMEAMKNTNLRLLADMENTRNIAKRDVENGKAYAIKGFAKDLLEVADNLELALGSVDLEKLEGEGNAQEQVRTLYEGVEMTTSCLQKALQRNGVQNFGVVGDVFDPNIHDAMFEAPAAEGQESGTLSTVIKTGYMIKDRVLRAAQVGTVAKA